MQGTLRNSQNPGPASSCREAQAISTFSALFGAMVLARAVSDERFSREILKTVAQLLNDPLRKGTSVTALTRFRGYTSALVGEFRPLQNHSCFLKIQPWIARVELAWVSIAQVAEEIDLPLAVRKEFGIQFVRIETGHRSTI